MKGGLTMVREASCALLASVALAEMVSGCAPSVSGSLLPDASFPVATPGDGAALFGLHVTVDSSSDNRAVGQFLTFERVSPPFQKRFAIFDLKNQSVFLVSLPPGTYATYFEVYTWARLADGRSGVSVPAPAPFDEFVVKPGTIAVLGALAFTATVTRQDIVTRVDLDGGMGSDALARAALERPEARERGWSQALESLLADPEALTCEYPELTFTLDETDFSALTQDGLTEKITPQVFAALAPDSPVRAQVCDSRAVWRVVVKTGKLTQADLDRYPNMSNKYFTKDERPRVLAALAEIPI